MCCPCRRAQLEADTQIAASEVMKIDRPDSIWRVFALRDLADLLLTGTANAAQTI